MKMKISNHEHINIVIYITMPMPPRVVMTEVQIESRLAGDDFALTSTSSPQDVITKMNEKLVLQV